MADATDASAPVDAGVSENTTTAAQPMRRLMISKMILENFKSYYGVQVIGPFHKCFSAIVGPNGSGKSNVIDALLFVFGRRANQLREKRVSELIHNSDAHHGLETAKVAVYFQEIIDHGDEHGYDVVPDTEFVVARIASSNNTSRYTIDDKGSNLSEVTDLLKGKGIDLDNNRFLILQGEVESISLKPPKATGPHDAGLLEYLEDIIGTDKYVERIDESGKLVESLGEERQEHLHRVKLVEKEKGQLEGARDEAHQALSLEDQINIQTAMLYQIRARKTDIAAQKAGAELEAAAKQLAEERAKLQSEQSMLEELEGELQKKKAEHDTALAELKKSKSEFAAYERKDVQLREQLKHAKKQEKSLSDKANKETHILSEATTNVERYSAEVPKLVAAAETLAKQLAIEKEALDRIYESIKDETSGLQSEIEAKQKELEPWSTAVNTHTAARDVAQSELDLLTEQGDSARRALDEAEKAIEAISKSLPDHQAALKAKQAERDTLRNRVPAAKAELKEAVETQRELEKRISSMRGKLEEKKAEKQGDDSRGSVLESLLEQKKKNVIPGIWGRLGDLGRIDKKYDIAISTAAQAGLGHIVVDTRDDGQKCVEYLKEKQLGRATFIMLDAVAGVASRYQPKIKTPENVPRLIDLVTPVDPQLISAFYFALRDTLVATDLDQATKIAYGTEGQRWRVVTLNGELIDASGSMSGGGAKKVSGLMSFDLKSVDVAGSGSHSSQQEKEFQLAIHQAESELETAQASLAETRIKRQKLESEISQSVKQLKVVENECHKLELDVESLLGQKEELTAQIPALKDATKRDPAQEKKIDELRVVVEAETKELSTAQGHATLIGKVIADLKEKVMDAGGVRLRAQQFKVDQMQKEIDDNGKAVTRVKVQLKAAEKAVKKSEDKKVKFEADLVKAKEETEALKTEMTSMETGAAAVMETFRKTETLVQDRADELQEIQAKYESIKRSVASARSSEVDTANRVEDIEKAVRETSKLGDGWRKKLAAIRKTREKFLKESAVFEDDEEEEEVGGEGEGEGEMDEEKEKRKNKKEKEDPLAPKSEDELDEMIEEKKEQGIEIEIGTLQERYQAMKPNMAAILEYRKKEEIYLTRVAELDNITERRDKSRNEYDALRKKRLDEFMAGFSVITMKLKEMYQMITLGGDAELELVDSLDPFSEGIVFSVRPPKKSWKNISNLSGGEKTLASLALVFALHHYKPTPLYVMDEIDAALDFRNVSIVANYIVERTKDAQFVIISLRNNMFELGDRLVGIYKTNNCTKSITIDPKNVNIPGAGASAAPAPK